MVERITQHMELAIAISCPRHGRVSIKEMPQIISLNRSFIVIDFSAENVVFLFQPEYIKLVANGFVFKQFLGQYNNLCF
jgi:hypothetical protein